MATGTTLGIAGTFNIFVLEDHTQTNTDCEGRVAVGNKATYNSYGIGSRLSADKTRADLVVGMYMNIGYGSNQNGNSVIQNKNGVIQYNMSNPNGQLIKMDCSVTGATCIDFASAGTYLTALCTQLKAYTEPTGEKHLGDISVTDWGSLTLKGTASDYNVYLFNGASIKGTKWGLGNLTYLNIIAPSGSSNIIIATGTDLAMRNYAIKWNNGDFTPSVLTKTLWVFPECTTFKMESFGGQGAILAPNAKFTFNNGQTNGNVIVKNLEGTGEVHNYLYDGIIPVSGPSKVNLVSGKVWEDTNRNGIIDTGEVGVLGSKVELIDVKDQLVKKTMTTGTTGDFSFENVAVGTYYIRYTLPAANVNYEFVTAGNLVDIKGCSSSFSIAASEEVKNRNAPIATNYIEVYKRAFTSNTGLLGEGENIRYEIEVVNYSSAAIKSIQVVDALDSRTSYNNDAQLWIKGKERTDLLTVTQAGNTLVFAFSELAGKANANILFSVSNKSLSIGAKVTNKAAINYMLGEEVRQKETDVVTVQYAFAKMNVRKYASQVTMKGSCLTYQIVISNIGKIAVQGISVQDELPISFDLIGSQEGTADVSRLIEIKEGVLKYTDEETCPTLVGGGSTVTGFQAVLVKKYLEQLNSLSIQGLNVKTSANEGEIYGVIITLVGTVSSR